MIVTIIVILLLLLLSAIFSGTEIAFVSANKLEVEINKQKASSRNEIISKFYDDPNRFIGTMLVGNNIVLVAFTYFMAKLIEPAIVQKVGEGFASLLLSTVIITLIVLIFGEFIPKTIFRLFAIKAIYSLSYVLNFFYKFLHGPVWLLTTVSEKIIQSLFNIPVTESSYTFTRHDLQDLIEDSDVSEEEELEKDMFVNALHLEKKRVRDVMIPRNETVSIDVHTDIDTLIREFESSRHSRLIVHDGDIDHVLGYIHHRSLLDNPKDIKEILMPISFVPETMSIQDLLFQFVSEKNGIAIVVDEFGGTSGLITLEDILEEIFGEIEDEHDLEEYTEEVISDTEFVFSGRLEIEYLNEKYPQLHLPEDGEYHTLSGFIVMGLGDIPQQGRMLYRSGKKFILEEVSDTKIEKVRIIIEDEEEDL